MFDTKPERTRGSAEYIDHIAGKKRVFFVMACATGLALGRVTEVSIGYYFPWFRVSIWGNAMNKLLLAATLTLVSATSFAANNCDEVKAQIETKIKNVGVALYKLEIVDADANPGGKVVGTCDGGKKKIVYWRL